MNDGRGIDATLGILSGEGSQQIVLETRSLQPHALGMLQPSTWIWSIPTYFYVGGVCGASATLGAAAHLFGGRALRDLVMPCRWLSAVTGIASGALLIHDLGRPSRFLNMLRVFRPTSPMSVGSWVLTFCAGPAVGGAVFGRTWLGNLAAVTSGMFGMPLASYTGVLIANTAVPVWQEGRKWMPVLFIASGASAAAALLEAVSLQRSSRSAVELFGNLGSAAELFSIHALQAEISRVPPVARALTEGLPGVFWTSAKIFSAATLAISLFAPRSRGKRVATTLLGTAASLCVRWAVFKAGSASAADNEASFALQRDTLQRRLPAGSAKHAETGTPSAVSKYQHS